MIDQLMLDRFIKILVEDLFPINIVIAIYIIGFIHEYYIILRDWKANKIKKAYYYQRGNWLMYLATPGPSLHEDGTLKQIYKFILKVPKIFK